MKMQLVSFVIFMCTVLNLSAQYTEMVWDWHGVGFEVPDNFTIDINQEDEFSANNDELYLSLFPFQDIDVTMDDLSDAVIEIAEEMNYDNISDVGVLELNDFTGYYVEGEKDGVQAVIMTLLDELSSTNLIVVLVYTDDSFDQALRIAESFYAYD